MTLVGVLAIISGEADDSPGLQGLGVLVLLFAIYLLLRRKR
jgi:LPXTG-motif cell wall-anchored protein